MNDSELISLVYYNLDNSDTDNHTLREDIERSDAYYFGRLPKPATDGRSSAVALECQTMCTAVSAELVQAFTSDQPAQFQPTGDQDDLPAELESYAVNQALEDAGGYFIMAAAIDSALRYKNAATLVAIDELTTTETERLPGATAEEAAALIARLPDDMDAKITKVTDEVIEVQITQRTQEVRIDPIDISLLRYRKDWHKSDVSDIPYIGIEHINTTRSELLEMFPNKKDIIEGLPAMEGSPIYDSSTRSKLVGEERTQNSADSRENDLVQWHECWQQIPLGNGKTERHHVAVAHRKLLLDETWQGGVPIATGYVFPQPHRFQGISLVNKLEDIQERASFAQRMLDDNLSAGNLSRTAGYDVELDDVLSARSNGHIRLNSPNSQFMALPITDQSSQSLAYLEFLKGQRNERGGSALSLQDPMAESLKNQAGAVANQQAMGHQESLSAYISLNLGQSYVRSLWLTIHEQLRLRYNGQLSVRVADQYVPAQPSDWQPRTRLTLKAGMSASARNRKASNLWAGIQLQMSLLQSGVPIADVNGLHNMIRDWMLASDLDSANQYITDPQSQKGQQMAQQAAQQGQQQQQAAQQQAEKELMVPEQNKFNIAKMQDDTDRLKIATDAEVDEAKLVSSGVIEMEKLNRGTTEQETETGAGA